MSKYSTKYKDIPHNNKLNPILFEWTFEQIPQKIQGFSNTSLLKAVPSQLASVIGMSFILVSQRHDPMLLETRFKNLKSTV